MQPGDAIVEGRTNGCSESNPLRTSALPFLWPGRSATPNPGFLPPRFFGSGLRSAREGASWADVPTDNVRWLPRAARLELGRDQIHLEASARDRELTFDEWLELGIRRRFCSELVCATHDGLPYTDEEYTVDWEDPCIPAVRLWEEDQRHGLDEDGGGRDG